MIIIMKTIEVKEWNKSNWQITNMPDYNIAWLPRYIMEEEGGGMLSQTNQQLNTSLTT